MNEGAISSGPAGDQAGAISDIPRTGQPVTTDDKIQPIQSPASFQHQQQQYQSDSLANNLTPIRQIDSQFENITDKINQSQNVTMDLHQQTSNNYQQPGDQARTNPSPNVPHEQQQQPQPLLQTQPIPPPIKPLLAHESKSDIAVNITQEPQTPQKRVITKVKLSDELNIFDWLKTTDIINQIAERAKSSVDSVITTLDPGMKEYLYSGGNVNIVVICESKRLISPIRDAFQSVFGRATVVGARYNPPCQIIDYPIRTASGLKEAAVVAQEKIKKLRSDTSSIPQNQVIVALQSAFVSLDDEIDDNLDESNQPRWFLTYCMLIEDPILGLTVKSYSQFIPVDVDVVEAAKTSKYPDAFQDRHLGFSASIDELMASKFKLSLEDLLGDEHGCIWLPRWTGLYETQVIHELSLTLANAYRRKWDNCPRLEAAS